MFSREVTFRILDDTHLELLDWDKTSGKYVETGRIFTVVGEKEGVKTFVKNLGKTVNLSEEVPRSEVKIVENHDPDLLKSVREPVLDKPVAELEAGSLIVGDSVQIGQEKLTAGSIQVGKIVVPEKPKKERKPKQEKTEEAK